jgi:hypothetical protein
MGREQLIRKLNERNSAMNMVSGTFANLNQENNVQQQLINMINPNFSRVIKLMNWFQF